MAEIKQGHEMRIRDKLVSQLCENGLFKDQADQVIESYISRPAGDPMKDRLDEDERIYPAMLMAVTWVGVCGAAVDWIDKNAPGHWARGMFLPSVEDGDHG